MSRIRIPNEEGLSKRQRGLLIHREQERRAGAGKAASLAKSFGLPEEQVAKLMDFITNTIPRTRFCQPDGMPEPNWVVTYGRDLREAKLRSNIKFAYLHDEMHLPSSTFPDVTKFRGHMGLEDRFKGAITFFGRMAEETADKALEELYRVNGLSYEHGAQAAAFQKVEAMILEAYGSPYKNKSDREGVERFDRYVEESVRHAELDWKVYEKGYMLSDRLEGDVRYVYAVGDVNDHAPHPFVDLDRSIRRVAEALGQPDPAEDRATLHGSLHGLIDAAKAALREVE